MPKGAYAEVIKGPARRLDETPRAIEVEDSLVDALLVDIEKGGAKDALPLLAFTLERLYLEYGGSKQLKLGDYETLGRIKGSIEAAVQVVFRIADKDPLIPKEPVKRLALLRSGLIPWLADIDPETGEPRRRVARLSEIPTKSRALIQLFVDQHLLATDISESTGEQTIEPAHEALLRQWSLLQGWLRDDAGLLRVMDGVKRAAKDWSSNGETAAWLTHTGNRLEVTEQLRARPDLSASLTRTNRDYLAACRKAESTAKGKRRVIQTVIYALLLGLIGGLVGWIEQTAIKSEWHWFWFERPFAASKVLPFIVRPAAASLRQGDIFIDCAKEQSKDYCPTMVVVPADSFMMGSPSDEPGRWDNEDPRHQVTISKTFAVAKNEVTFDEWETCVVYGDCPEVTEPVWGRGSRPVINVTWYDAQRYVAWLVRVTGKPYRLLTEAEFEYAARAKTETAYPWGRDVGTNNADCNACGSQWDGKMTAPTGSFAANQFGLNDMNGNVWEWLQDCDHGNYNGAPTDGSAWISGDCPARIVRGGSWYVNPTSIRSAFRNWYPPETRNQFTGFRVGLSLQPQ